MLYSVTVAAVYESCELEKVRNIFYMLTHQIPPGCSLLGRTRPSRAARLAASGRMLAQRHRTHTCTHDTGDPRAYYMSKNARARARCTFTAVVHAPALVAAAPAASRPAMARSTAASRRLSHRPLAAPSPPRQTRRRERGPTAAAAAAAATAAAELLGSAPTMAAAADQPPVRIERRLLQPPRPAPAWPNAGREHRAGRRARRVGGVPTSAAGGARAQMPWRRILDTSSSLEIDGPAHARAVRGVEVKGSEDNEA